MVDFCKAIKIEPPNLKQAELFEFLFEEKQITETQINEFMNAKYREERVKRLANQDPLVDQLNRLEHFDWGGSYGNSLERNIVNNYVKEIQSYDAINKEIEGSLLASLRGYTLNSWYNHWTSILIEDLFKDHDSVLPTVGQVKKIDFFINDIPFDLKVTYFPEGLLKQKLKSIGYGNELTKLKKICRKLDIFIPTDIKNENAFKKHLYTKVSEDQRQVAKEFIKKLNDHKRVIISEAEANPNELKTWLYENQGEARFDASNRFFLVLTDVNDMSNSWKLKRNIVFLKEQIDKHLKEFELDLPSLETKFYWKNDQKTYTCKSDILFLKYDN